MKTRKFKTFEDMAEYMVDQSEDGKLVSAVAYFEDAVEIFKELFRHNLDITDITICESYIDGYGYEYIVSILDNKLFVEKAYDVDKKLYRTTDSDIILLCNDYEFDGFSERDEHVEKYTVGENFDCDEDDWEDGCLYKVIDRDGNIAGKISITIQ